MKEKILITGGTGFIGSHLAEYFAKKNFEVTVFDRYNSNYSLGNLKNSKYKDKIKFIFGDIPNNFLEFETMAKTKKTRKPKKTTSGKSKRKLTDWQKFVKKTIQENKGKLNMVNCMKLAGKQWKIEKKN